MAEQTKRLLRELPSVDRLLNHPKSEPLLARFSRDYVTQKLRVTLDELRRAIQQGSAIKDGDLQEESILERIEKRTGVEG